MFQNYNSFGYYTRPQQQLNGRIVTSIDEVRASQIALDGSISYFPSPAENKVYAKFVGMDGLPVIVAYELSKGQAPKTEADEINEMKERISRIECFLREVKDNVKSDANSTTSDASSTVEQSNAGSTKYSWK